MKKTNTLMNLVTAGLVGVASILPGKSLEGQTVEGWFEATLGTPSENIRLYPRASLGPVNLQSLIDINDYWQFSKTDLYSQNIEKEMGNFALKPVLTFFQDKTGKRIMPGINVAYGFDSFFGFTEFSADDLNTNKTKYYTYNGIAGEEGSCAVFLTSSLNHWERPYVEIECTGHGFGAISPYARVNLVKGTEPTYQAGVSVNPGKIIGK